MWTMRTLCESERLGMRFLRFLFRPWRTNLALAEARWLNLERRLERANHAMGDALTDLNTRSADFESRLLAHQEKCDEIIALAKLITECKPPWIAAEIIECARFKP